MKKYKVNIRIHHIGIKTYYEPEMQKSIFGISYWVPFFVAITRGEIILIKNFNEDYQDAREHIERLKKLYGENNVEDHSAHLKFLSK